MTILRQSPIQIASSETATTMLFNARVISNFGAADEERAAAETLALSDVSWLPKWGAKGRGAAEVLASRGLPVPASLYEVVGPGVMARTGTQEFFLEEALDGSVVETLPLSVGAGEAWSPIPRQEAGFWLGGERAYEVMAQTCGLNLRRMRDQIVFTRVAGVSVMLLCRAAPLRIRVWCDFNYGPYLWETLETITKELGGRVVGLDAVCDRL